MSVSGFRGNCHINCTYSDNEMHCTYSDDVWSVGCQSASKATFMMVDNSGDNMTCTDVCATGVSGSTVRIQ